MIKDFDTVWQMYVTVSCGANDAIELLLENKCDEAEVVLIRALREAEKLYISQPSLSQYLKRLENSLGVELFDRGALPLRLSFAGERYYEYVLQMMKLEENMRRELQDIKNQESGVLRLGVALWRGACLLPDVFPYFHEHYPGIRVELTEGRTSQLVNALTNDKIDIAIMNLPALMNYSTLTCETIFEEPILPELIWPLAAVFRKDVYLSRISRLFIDTLKILLGIKFE